MSDDRTNGDTQKPDDFGAKKWEQSHISWLKEASEASRLSERKESYSDIRKQLSDLSTDQIRYDPVTVCKQKALRLWTEFNASYQYVAENRYRLKSEKQTLAHIGDTLDLTRERVRQIQVRIYEKFIETLADDLLPLVDHLSDLSRDFVLESDFDGNADQVLHGCPEVQDRILKEILKSETNYCSIRGCRVSPQGQRFIEHAKRQIEISPSGLVKSSVLSEIDPDFWHDNFKSRELLARSIGFVLLQNGSIAIRDTLPARVIDALLYVGTPMTKEEIVVICGISEDKIIHRLWSIEEVVKVSNNMWSLVSRDIWSVKSSHQPKYIGAVEEMIRLLQENGGEMQIEDLKVEVKKRCNIKESSIKAFLYTLQFIVKGKTVSLRRDDDTIPLRRLEDAIDGRTPRGSPYWLFTVHDRHLRGNAVTGFPPELADYTNCGPNKSVSLPVETPPGCRNITVSWRLASTNGVQIGFLSDVLKHMNCNVGQQLRLIVLPTKHVAIHRHVAF